MPGRLDPEPVARRDFLGIASMATAGAAIFGSLLGMLRLAKPRVLPEASARVRVGKPSDYAAGTSKVLTSHNVLMIRNEQGIAALSLVCTHLGCIVEPDASGFKCPCHGSKFNADGTVVAGPAPEPLHWLSIGQTADGSLIVDKELTVPAGEFYELA